ncbi:MAG TPA: 50S ribosomal protein L9 [Chloroflexi bacterium]|nr:50S ribosomal protein L9 [Chloroflexota bacterium]
MKVLLVKDVYKLGRAGDIKRVADGYGRNYLIPQGLAVLATPGAVKQADKIREKAAAERALLNKEMSAVAERINGAILAFPMRAGDTGKLYGSVTPQMIADELKRTTGVDVDRRQIETQPIRNLGEYTAHIRLTMDLVPEITVIVHREGEIPAQLLEKEEAAEEAAETETEAEAEAVEEAPEAPAETGEAAAE